MPCNSDYLEATDLEVNHAIVLALLEELETGKLPEYYGDGYYEKVYNKTTKEKLDLKVAELCKKLKKRDKEIYPGEVSLEMQIWWRDHKKADAKRLEKEKKERKQKLLKNSALAKLTNEERKALGL